jgi:hypothetical protein
MTSSMTPPSPFWARTPAPPLVSAEEAPPKTETTSSEDLLRKMIVEKISGAEVVVASMESSIAEKERLIAENRDTLAGSREEILNLRKQLAILDSMSGVVPPTKVCEGVTRGWTKVEDHTAYIGQAEGLQPREENVMLREEGARFLKAAGEYGGYVTGRGQCWIRVQTRNPNDLLKNMTQDKGSVVYISPGASIDLIKKSGYACVWSHRDKKNNVCES